VRKVLCILLAVATVASAAALLPRAAYDRAQGDRVELVAGLGRIVGLADRQGLPARVVLEDFSRAGLTSVFATPEELARLEAERGPLLTGGGVLMWSPVLHGSTGQSAADVEALLREVAVMRDAGVPTGTVLLDGDAVPGFPASLEVTAAGLRDLGLPLGLVEDPSQLGYVPLAGTADLAALLDYSLLRVYRPPASLLESPQRLAEKVARSVKERGLRVVRLDLFAFYSEPPAAWMTGPAGEEGLLAANLRYVKEVRESLEAAGFEVGPAAGPPHPFRASPVLLAAIALGPWVVSAALLDLAVQGRLGRRRGGRLAVLLAGSVAAGCVLLLATRLPGALPLVQKLVALWAALVYPALAGVWLVRRWGALREGAARPTWSAVLGEVLAAAVLALVGGAAVAGAMSDVRFAVEMEYFRGVKLSYVVPPAVVLLASLWFAAPPHRRTLSGLREAVGRLGRMLTGEVRLRHVAAGLALALVLVVYVGRSGDQPWLPVSSVEVAARAWLDRTFHAQPRLKEFLVGYPSLMLGSYLARTGRRRWLPLWGAAGTVGLVSVVNSFEHVRTPVALTLTRTVNGALLGFVVGSVAVLAAAALVRGRSAEGPGRGTAAAGGSVPPSGGRVDILGVGVSRLTFEEAVARAARLVRAAGSSGEARLIFTPNPEMLYRAARDPGFAAELGSADMLVADGVGVVWASRVLGAPLPERVSGVDLLTRLMEKGREVHGDRPLCLFLLGSRPGVAEEAAARIRERYDGVAVVGWHHGYFSPEEEAGVLSAVHRARPDLLVVGLGSPKQEKWLVRHRAALGGMAAVGIGGALDVLSGRTRRAPACLRRLGLEWVYRILSQPRARLGRVPALVGFVAEVFRARLGRGRARGGRALRT